MSKFLRVCAGFAMCAVLFVGTGAAAQSAPEVPDITKVPVAAQPSDHFDVDAATDAYLALMPASARSRSDAYFEGGYWLILWDFLVGAVIALLLLNLGWSAWMRNLAERITRWRWLQTFIYWVEYLLLTSTQIRSQEAEADSFGINASRQPDGMAQAAIHLGEYRKMKPGPMEEWMFFDHPSGYDRIHKAMQWKLENLQLYKQQP